MQAILLSHAAGRPGHPRCGAQGKNKSSFHWDKVCDTRKGFTIYGDRNAVMKDGKWLL